MFGKVLTVWFEKSEFCGVLVITTLCMCAHMCVYVCSECMRVYVHVMCVCVHVCVCVCGVHVSGTCVGQV